MAMSGFGEHVREDDFERYSMGALRPDEMERCEGHLLLCADCRAGVAESDVYVAAMRLAATQHRAEALPGERRGVWEAARQWWAAIPAWAPVAAGLAVLGLTALLFFSGRPHPVTLATFTVHLTAMRGNDAGNAAPANAPLVVEPDLTGVPPAPTYALDVVNSEGKQMAHASLASAVGSAHIPPLRAGSYFVRVSSEGNKLYREYGLEVK